VAVVVMVAVHGDRHQRQPDVPIETMATSNSIAPKRFMVVTSWLLDGSFIQDISQETAGGRFFTVGFQGKICEPCAY